LNAARVTTAEIKALRMKFIVALVSVAQGQRGSASLALSAEELGYLAHLMRSHILWRAWLVPDE
jgi:hypothetical protein